MNTTDNRVLWRQVWGLAALLAAIVFSWMAYGFYQPVILTKLGFVDLARNLGIIQGFLGAAIEPLVGAMSDRSFQRVHSRLPVIAVGITLAGLLFVAIGLLLHANIPQQISWIVPVLMTVWVVAMITFRGPAIALLRQFAPTSALPAANSILTVVIGIVSALDPIFARIIELLGAANTFLLGAVMLMVGAILLWSSEPQLVEPLAADRSIVTTRTRSQQGIQKLLVQRLQIFAVGLGSGLVVNILLRICPHNLHRSLDSISPEYITVLMLIICTIAAIPLEHKVKKWGLNRSMVIGICAIALLVTISSIFNLTAISIASVLLGGVALSLLLVAQIPWCFSRLADRSTGLATGLYFGGMGAATAFIGIIFRH